MKLRLQGNSVRLRLTRSEVERLRETGLVEESVNFGGGEMLTYRLQSRMEQGPVEAVFGQGILTVSLSKEAAHAWAGSDDVGVYAQSGALTISIEKDFRCLIRPREDERDAYAHPGQRS
jgi:HSP20 family molecular chaperone IbpA